MVFPDPFDATTSGESLNLKKATEEGLGAVLADAANPATATVTYKVKKHVVYPVGPRSLMQLFFSSIKARPFLL
jgi:hypothetical protein